MMSKIWLWLNSPCQRQYTHIELALLCIQVLAFMNAIIFSLL